MLLSCVQSKLGAAVRRLGEYERRTLFAQQRVAVAKDLVRAHMQQARRALRAVKSGEDAELTLLEMEVGRLTSERDLLAMRLAKLQDQSAGQVDRIKEEVGVYAARLMRTRRYAPSHCLCVYVYVCVCVTVRVRMCGWVRVRHSPWYAAGVCCVPP